MVFGKSILRVVLVTALAVYAVDCVGMSMALQAVHCCKAMPCHSKASPEKCCKTMNAHAPFVKTTSVSNTSLSSFEMLALPVSEVALATGRLSGAVVANGHAPPILRLLTSSPLRI